MKTRHLKSKPPVKSDDEKLQEEINKLESRQSQDARRHKEDIKHHKD